MQITIAPPARMILEQLSTQDRARIDRALLKLERKDETTSVTRVVPIHDGRRPYYVMPASDDLRVFFERSDDAIDVIDIATKAQLSFFRREPA